MCRLKYAAYNMQNEFVEYKAQNCAGQNMQSKISNTKYETQIFWHLLCNTKVKHKMKKYTAKMCWKKLRL